MVNPIDFFNGSNHGYSDVVVKKYGFDVSPLTSTVYYFSNIIDASGGNLLLNDTVGLGYTNIFPRTSINQPAMGLIKEVDEFSNLTSPGISPYKTTTYTYTFDNYTPTQNMAVFQSLYQPLGALPSGLDSIYVNNNFNATGKLGGGGYLNSKFYFTVSIPGGYTGPYLNEYTRNYNVFNSSAVRVASKVEAYNLSSNISSSETDYTYDSHDQLSTESWTDSKGGSFTKKYFHNYDYGIQSGTIYANQVAALSTIQTMNSTGLQTIITQQTTKNAGTYNPAEIVQFSQVLPNYTTVNGVGVTTMNTIAKSTLQQPVATALFQPSVPGFAYSTNYFFKYDTNVNDIKQITRYDDHNNSIEATSDNGQRITSAIWDTHIAQPIANAINAQYNDIAYSSFEESVNAYGVADYNKGNWDYYPLSIVFGSTTKPFTGKYYCQLSTGGTNNIIKSTAPLSASTTYLLSFWCDIPPTVTVNGTAVTMQYQTQAGAWKLYTAYVHGTGVVQLASTASGNKIDELRLLPEAASMDTYTYEPLNGISSHCDERNNVIYYQYDPFGHLKATTDIMGNIISLTNTVIAGSDN